MDLNQFSFIARKLLVFIAFLFFQSLFAQQVTVEEIQGNWYSTDGSNELKLMVKDDFALFDGNIWDFVSFTDGVLNLKTPEKEIKITLENTNGTKTLVYNGISYPIQKSRKTDISKRTVGSANVENDFFKNDQVVLQGMIIPKDTLPLTVSIIYNDPFAEEQKKFVGIVDENGLFNVTYPLQNPQKVMIMVGSAFFTYLTTPGAKQAMIIDEASFSSGIQSWYEVKGIDFMGDLALENEELSLLNPEFMKIRDYLVNDSLQKALDSDAYMDYRLDLWKKHTKFFDLYFDSLSVSELVKDFSYRNARINAASDLKRYIWMHNLGKNGGIITPVDVSDEYNFKTLALISNEKEELMAEDYGRLIRDFAMHMTPKETKEIADLYLRGLYDFLTSKNLPDSSVAKVEAWKLREEGRENSLGNLKFDEGMEVIVKDFSEEIMEISVKSRWDYMLPKIEDFGLINKSAVVSIFIDQNFLNIGMDVPGFILEDLKSLKLQPEVEANISQGIADFEILKNKKFVEGVNITESADNILFQLKEKYKNKVVYVDVWATWCGPCISEFGHMKEIKENNLEDVVFVYLCAESSRKSFDTMVKKHELTGDNYFLDNTQYQNFDKEVGISGFPTYMIITKVGKLIRDGINRPSSGELLVNQLKEFSGRN